jgi:hypothetical protein
MVAGGWGRFKVYVNFAGIFRGQRAFRRLTAEHKPLADKALRCSKLECVPAETASNAGEYRDFDTKLERCAPNLKV